MRNYLILFFIILSHSLIAQNKIKIRDIKGQVYIQPESSDNLEYQDWLQIPSNPFEDSFMLNDFSTQRDDVTLTDGNIGILASISIINETEARKTFKGGLRLGLMYATERDYGDFFQNISTPDTITDNSISMTQERGMLRFECGYRLRTDDQKPLFVTFGLGSQWGISLNSKFEAEEIRVVSVNDGFGIFSSESEKSSYSSEARNVFTSFIFIPADVNAKLGDNFYLNFELRYGLKYLQFSGGPDTMHPVLGIGFGLRVLI